MPRSTRGLQRRHTKRSLPLKFEILGFLVSHCLEPGQLRIQQCRSYGSVPELSRIVAAGQHSQRAKGRVFHRPCSRVFVLLWSPRDIRSLGPGRSSRASESVPFKQALFRWRRGLFLDVQPRFVTRHPAWPTGALRAARVRRRTRRIR